MPQRYYGRYGYGPSEEELQNLGGPFFNPYSKRGDVGYALRQAVNMLLAKKREEQDTAKTQAKEDWERKFKEAEFGLRERQVAVQERPDIQKPPTEQDFVTGAKILMESNPEKYKGDLGLALQDYFMMQRAPKEPPKTAMEIEGEAYSRARGAGRARREEEEMLAGMPRGVAQLSADTGGTPMPSPTPPPSPRTTPSKFTGTLEGDYITTPDGKKYRTFMVGPVKKVKIGDKVYTIG